MPAPETSAYSTVLDRIADGVGVVTLAVGTALVVAPRRTSQVLGLGDDPYSPGRSARPTWWSAPGSSPNAPVGPGRSPGRR